MDSQWPSHEPIRPASTHESAATGKFEITSVSDLNGERTIENIQLRQNDGGKDPRLHHPNYGKRSSKGIKIYRTQLALVHFEFDEYSLGPKPLTTVLLTNLSPLTTEAQIATYLSVYGEVERVEIEKHPATGGSLGIASVGFGGNGQDAARKAVKTGNRRRMGPANNVRIEHDPTGDKLKVAVAKAYSDNDDISINNESATKPSSSSTSSSSSAYDNQPPPPHSATYHEEGEIDGRDRDYARWSRRDSYRYQRSRDYIDDRYYYDDRYRDYANGGSSYSTSSSTAIPRPRMPSTSPTRATTSSSSRYIMSHSSYNSRKHSNDRYESTSRFYGVSPPPPPHYRSSSSNSKWDQPRSHHLQKHYGSEIYSARNSRSRSRSRSRSIGRDSSSYYEKGSRWDYDARCESTDYDRDRRRKRSGMWKSHEDRPPEEDRSLVTDKLPSLTISKKVLPFIRGVLEELRKVFYHYGSIDIYHDTDNWFVVFDSSSTAKQALTEMEGQSVFGYLLYMTLQDPSTTADLSTQQESAQRRGSDYLITPSPGAPNSSDLSSLPKPNNNATSSNMTAMNELPANDEPTLEQDEQADSQLVNNTLCTASNENSSPSVPQTDTNTKLQQHGYENIKDHAKQLLFDQLADVFLKDLKNRVVGPCIYDFLNPALHKRTAERLDSGLKITTNNDKTYSYDNHHQEHPLSHLPSMESDNCETIYTSQDAIHTDNTTAHTDTDSTTKNFYSNLISYGHTTTTTNKKEDDGLFSLPKPEETTNEGPLPSLNKLPRFKKRPKDTSTIKSSNTPTATTTTSDLYGNVYKHHSYRHSYSPRYRDGYGDTADDNSDDDNGYGYGNNRYSHHRNSVKQEKGKLAFVSSSSRRHSNGTTTLSVRSTSNTEQPSGATFFSSSEEGEYQSGASVASSDDQDGDKVYTTTTNGRKGTGGTTAMDRKKPRRLRDYLSDEEDEFDQEVHDAFLRQLHQDENGDGDDDEDDNSQFVNKQKPPNDVTWGTFGHDNFIVDDGGKNDSESGDDDDDYDGDIDHGTTKRLYKKQRQRNKLLQPSHTSNSKKHRLSSSAVPGWMEGMVVDGDSGNANGYKRRKKGTSLLQQHQRSRRDNDTLDLGRLGTRMDVDTTSDSSEDDDMGTGKNHRPQKKTQTEHGSTKSFALDQEAYERMLLAPDSPDDDHMGDNDNDGDAGKQGTLQHEDDGDNTTLQDGTTIDRSDWDPFRQVQDVEDYEFLRLVILEKLSLGVDISEVDNVGKRINGGGCARSRGYYVIPDAEKATYLPKNQAVLDTSTSTSTSSSLNGRLSSSRTNRVNNRRFVVGMVMQKAMADSDILKFNQFKGRKKQLRFAKSPIHDWGLYAEEHIDVNDMVIEYVGEVIRQQVAEEREKRYERCGIGSSYLFRVDDDIVIDATKMGSIARFINHCCSPNCSAKIITVDKQKKIVIYANRDIEPGEEITYDYKFPLETDKIPCLCGSKSCKGTLN